MINFTNSVYVVFNGTIVDSVWYDYTNHGAGSATEVKKYVDANKGFTSQLFELKDRFVSDDEVVLQDALIENENQRLQIIEQLRAVKSGRALSSLSNGFVLAAVREDGLD